MAAASSCWFRILVGHAGSLHSGSRHGVLDEEALAEGIDADEALVVVVDDDDDGGEEDAIELPIDAAKLARKGFDERRDGGKAPLGGNEGNRDGSKNGGGRYVPRGMSRG